MATLVDHFIPDPDIRERHETIVRAPSSVVMEVAQSLNMDSVFLVRGIFWLRAKLLGATLAPATRRAGLVKEMIAIGWGVLADEPGRLYIAGAYCQPWRANVVFRPIPADQFAAFAERDQVKIVWTLEAVALDSALTRFATETRVRATDIRARERFRRYWRMFGLGIVMIRRLLLSAMRRQAEQRWRATSSLSVGQST